MDGESIELRAAWLTQPAHAPAITEERHGSGEPIGETLHLARSIATRLAHVAEPEGAASNLRLARALALNLVDLLEELEGSSLHGNNHHAAMTAPSAQYVRSIERITAGSSAEQRSDMPARDLQYR